MEQDWIMGLIGGVLIGTGGAVYLLGAGRIMGASGIIGGLVDGSARREWRARALFLLGLIAVPALLTGVLDTQTNVTGNLALLALAGALVGFGTRLANGCTSGHGVCGMSRLAPRGIAATAVYMAAGIATVLVLRMIGGLG